jgi:hypothetical protein
MLSFLLSALNPISKLIDVIGSYLNKRQDVDLEKYKVKGQVDIKAVEADIAIITARTQLAAAQANDPATKTARLFFMIPASWYFGYSFFHATFANLLPPSWLWKPLSLSPTLEYLAYAIIAYLFYTAWRGRG